MAKASGLGNRLRLPGKVSADVLQRLFAQASVFALATRYEGYGIVFDEALSHGLPIVSCATGAVPETVPAEARLLVPPDDTTSFAAALRDLLEHPEKRARLASASAALATALPGWANTAQAAGTMLDGPCFD